MNLTRAISITIHLMVILLGKIAVSFLTVLGLVGFVMSL